METNSGNIWRMCGESRPGRWMRQLKEYMEELEISFDRLESMTKLELDRVVDRLETDMWRDLENRTTLWLYRNKVEIGKEGIYRNVIGSLLMLQYLTDTLRLRWREGYSGGAVECLLCGAEDETVEHFVTVCERIKMTRERHGARGDVRMDNVLLFEGRTEEKVERFTKIFEEGEDWLI